MGNKAKKNQRGNERGEGDSSIQKVRTKVIIVFDTRSYFAHILVILFLRFLSLFNLFEKIYQTVERVFHYMISNT